MKKRKRSCAEPITRKEVQLVIEKKQHFRVLSERKKKKEKKGKEIDRLPLKKAQAPYAERPWRKGKKSLDPFPATV